MLASLPSIGIICLMLLCGYILGKTITDKVRYFLIGLISKIVVLLLFLMGIDIGWVFVDDKVNSSILWDALVFSSLISIFVFGFLVRKNTGAESESYQSSFISPLFGCLTAVLAFVVGVISYKYFNAENLLNFISVDAALYLLIFLVGVDLVSFSIKQLSLIHLKTPLFTIIATAVACYFYSFISDRSLKDLLLASSGHGWFTLSGPMITSLKGPELGMFAFLTDIFREMLSIVMLYLLGTRHSHSSIGVSGAAALDSALPFIKENCNKEDIDYAIASGFILTLLAPIFIASLAIV